MLKGILVLDCTGRLGWLAGRLLADLGADVVRIENPDAEIHTADWRALNVNKRLARLDLGASTGQRELDRLAAGADILLATPAPGTPTARLFDHGRLSAINPRLIVVAITPFGLTGPKAGWTASDLEIMAASGAMSLAGEPEGTPLRVSAPQSCGWAGSQAAVGALIALAARSRTGRGQSVDVSAQAATLVAVSHAPAFVDVDGTTPTRAGAFMTGRSVKGARYRVFWPCRDGFVNFILYGGVAGRRTNAQLVAWMRESGAPLGALAHIDLAKWDPTLATQAEVDALEAPIAAFFCSIAKRQFLEEAHRREMLGYPVSTVADIAADPQLAARGFWQDVAAAGGKVERHCGCFAIIDGARPLLESRNDAQVQAARAAEVA
jgi:crotonobetainyl-CoA:carnitine CoA-transferase CaiB-like acyl-CoA transferase